jgi:hypothetical protein
MQAVEMTRFSDLDVTFDGKWNFALLDELTVVGPDQKPIPLMREQILDISFCLRFSVSGTR